MARKAQKKANIVTVDFTGVDEGGGSFTIKDGSYPMKVVKVTEEESKAGNDMLVFTFEGTAGAAKGKSFKQWAALTPDSLWKLKSLLKALGQEVPDSPHDIDLDELVDLELTGVVSKEDYNGKTSSKMTDFGPLEEEEEEEEKPAKGKKKKDDDEDEKPVKGKKKAADDDDDEDKKLTKEKKKGKTLEKLETDEVKAMDDDELAELVEKYELDVDLGEFKTMRRKVGAVLAELEAKDLIED
jgi:hypothetical protein